MSSFKKLQSGLRQHNHSNTHRVRGEGTNHIHIPFPPNSHISPLALLPWLVRKTRYGVFEQNGKFYSWSVQDVSQLSWIYATTRTRTLCKTQKWTFEDVRRHVESRVYVKIRLARLTDIWAVYVGIMCTQT